MVMNDNVSKPSHYQFNSECNEVRDVIKDRIAGVVKAYDGQGAELAYDYSNAIKYLLRWYAKNRVEDLRKARFCIDSMLQELCGEESTRD